MHYKKTYLKQVILRLDYNRLAAFLTDQETPFTKDMGVRYPEVTSNAATDSRRSSGQAARILGSRGRAGYGFTRHKIKPEA